MMFKRIGYLIDDLLYGPSPRITVKLRPRVPSHHVYAVHVAIRSALTEAGLSTDCYALKSVPFSPNKKIVFKMMTNEEFINRIIPRILFYHEQIKIGSL